MVTASVCYGHRCITFLDFNVSINTKVHVHDMLYKLVTYHMQVANKFFCYLCKHMHTTADEAVPVKGVPCRMALHCDLHC